MLGRYLIGHSYNGERLTKWKSGHTISPLHGRSYVIGKTINGRYIVSKGNGLSYTQWTFLHTPEMGNDTWGLLLKQDAIRDYTIGKEVEALGIKTNHMHCVIELDYPIYIPQTGDTVNPVLLQYDVECPYRIEDAAFMEYSQIISEIEKWQTMNTNGRDKYHLIAADILLGNLRILHDHQILHNALTTHNHTWALELVDFELASSPSYPYASEDDQRHVQDLFDRELLDIYRIIIYIAGVLRETVDYFFLDSLFKENGFDLGTYKI